MPAVLRGSVLHPRKSRFCRFNPAALSCSDCATMSRERFLHSDVRDDYHPAGLLLSKGSLDEVDDCSVESHSSCSLPSPIRYSRSSPVTRCGTSTPASRTGPSFPTIFRSALGRHAVGGREVRLSGSETTRSWSLVDMRLRSAVLMHSFDTCRRLRARDLRPKGRSHWNSQRRNPHSGLRIRCG
jgi:hypothetical protein